MFILDLPLGDRPKPDRLLAAAMINAVRGYGLVKAGDIEAGTMELAAAVAWFERSSLRYTRSLFGSWLAESRLRAGERGVARRLLGELLETTRHDGYQHLEGIAMRLLGEYFLDENLDEAGAHLRRSSRRSAPATRAPRRSLLTASFVARPATSLAPEASLERACKLFEELGTLDEPRRAGAIIASLSP